MTLFDTLLEANRRDWQSYIQHPFVQQIGQGTLATECFEHYLKQDYVFLIHFARAFGLAVFKSNSIEEIEQAKSSKDDLSATVESTSNMAYTRYVMERGLSGNLLDLNVALAPCIIGYAEVANWLLSQSSTVREGNPYDEWITMYASDEYQDVASAHKATLNKVIPESIAQSRVTELCGTFGSATRLEIDFWQMGIDLT